MLVGFLGCGGGGAGAGEEVVAGNGELHCECLANCEDDSQLPPSRARPVASELKPARTTWPPSSPAPPSARVPSRESLPVSTMRNPRKPFLPLARRGRRSPIDCVSQRPRSTTEKGTRSDKTSPSLAIFGFGRAPPILASPARQNLCVSIARCASGRRDGRSARRRVATQVTQVRVVGRPPARPPADARDRARR